MSARRVPGSPITAGTTTDSPIPADTAPGPSAARREEARMPHPSTDLRERAPLRAPQILDLVGALPDHSGFPTVDELHRSFEELARSTDRVGRRRIGTSRLGEPIHEFVVGDGPHQAVIVGGVHPNEPIGSWTALHLAEMMLDADGPAEQLATTWHIVPTIDPDGMRLNEDWFADPFDRAHYSRHFFRPAPDSQVEWTFPTDFRDAYFDAVLPETLALMRLIDDVRPDLLVTLHNGEMGGVYYYLSHDEPDLISDLHAIPDALGLALDTGEPESPHLRTLATAVFAMDHISTYYEYLESIGLDPAPQIRGSSSASWGARHDALCLVAELPYWTHPDAGDETPTDEPYRDLVLRTAAAMGSSGEALQEILDEAEAHLTLQTPYLEASRAFVPMLGSIAETDRRRAPLEPAERRATVAERFACEDLVRGFRLRYGGMLLRAIEAETGAGIAPAPLRALRARMAALYEEWLADAATGATPIPMRTLVGVQLGAVLAGAAHVAATRPTRDAPSADLPDDGGAS